MEMYDFDNSDHEDGHKPDGSDLLTKFDQLRGNAEMLSMKSIYNVQVPLCGFLNQLTSTDCLKLIVSAFSSIVQVKTTFEVK